MEIVLIRHGEPEWVRDGLNVVDPPLTQLGRRQAGQLADALVAEQFDEILVSPLVRARQTAAPLLSALGRAEVIDPWLEEIRDPVWHGTPAEKAAEAYAELRGRRSEDRWHGLDGGESIRDFVTRIRSGGSTFLADRGVIRSESELPIWQIAEPGARIALIAHAGTNSVMIGHLLGLEPTPWEWDRFVLGHTSISRIEAMELEDGYTFTLTKLSDLEHLDREQRTRYERQSHTIYRRGMAPRPEIAADPELLKYYSFSVFTQLSGAVTAGMIHLGDRLGLYAALAAADEPLTTTALADRTGLDERWVREWAYNQAAAKLVSVDATDTPEQFWLTPEAVAVLASPDHPAFGMGMFHRFPQTMAALEVMPESFRTGLGHDYDSHGPEGAVGIERSFEPWNRHHLIPTVLPALDGIIERLETGIAVADVGCGAGGAVLLMAEAFPNSRFVGYDISHFALERAEHRRREERADNVRFVDPRTEPLPADHSIDFITTFDCIHDMTDPQGMIQAISDAIAPDGTWLLVDIKGRSTFAENVEKNPMASLMYGISVLSCMSSALSEPGGAGLGTLGLPASRAREMAAAAELTRFRTLDVDHSVNAFYEVRR